MCMQVKEYSKYVVKYKQVQSFKKYKYLHSRKYLDIHTSWKQTNIVKLSLSFIQCNLQPTKNKLKQDRDLTY